MSTTTDLTRGEIADICDKAADVIQTEPAACQVDVIDAIGIALYGTPRYVETRQSMAVEQALTDRTGRTVANWCSLPCRTKHDAITLLRTTAAELRAEVTA